MAQNRRGPKLTHEERNVLINGLIADKSLSQIQASFRDIGSTAIVTSPMLSYYRGLDEVKQRIADARNDIFQSGAALLHRRIDQIKSTCDLLNEQKRELSEYFKKEKAADKLPNLSSLFDLARTEVKVIQCLTELLGETDERRGTIVANERKATQPEPEFDLEAAERNPLYNIHDQYLDMWEQMINDKDPELTKYLKPQPENSEADGANGDGEQGESSGTAEDAL